MIRIVKTYKFKAKDSEVNAAPLCLGNASKDFSADNIKKIGLDRYVYDFSVDYDSIDVNDILNIHKYLLVKNNIKWCSGLLNKYLVHYWVLVGL